MTRRTICSSAAMAAIAPLLRAQAGEAVLRVAYLANNPAQAVKDPATGQMRGVAVDITAEIAKRIGTGAIMMPMENPQALMDAVARDAVDLGFVAYAAARRGQVQFSQAYLLNTQTFLVPAASPLKDVKDVDRAGMRLGGAKGDSISLYLGRTLKQAKLVETAGTLEDTKKQFEAKAIDAFGANTQRLTTWLKDFPGYRLLTGSVMEVPQTIAVANGNVARLSTVNAYIDDMRKSGFLQNAIKKSGIVGVEMAPAGYGYGKAE